MEQQGGNMDSVSTRTQRESEKGKDGVGETIDDELLAATTATRMASRRKGRALTVLFRASHAPHERARGEKRMTRRCRYQPSIEPGLHCSM
jgi:hypothetical protein